MKDDKPTGYELSRQFFDFCFENPEKIRPIHSAVYFFAIEHCNRLGWKHKFGFPSQMAMDAIGVRNWRTYIVGFNDLCEWGFFQLIEKAKNQYSSNIIAIVKNTKAHTKALDKALQKHSQKQSNSIVSIDKQYNNEQRNHRTGKAPQKFKSPLPSLVRAYMIQQGVDDHTSLTESERFCDFYTSKGWMVGKNKMKDWQAAARQWIKRMDDFKPNRTAKGETNMADLIDQRTY